MSSNDRLYRMMFTLSEPMKDEGNGKLEGILCIATHWIVFLNVISVGQW